MSTNLSEKSFSSTFRVNYSTLEFKEMFFFPEKLLPIYQTTQRQFLEDYNLVTLLKQQCLYGSNVLLGTMHLYSKRIWNSKNCSNSYRYFSRCVL
jgi:uncharacterized membrane protein